MDNDAKYFYLRDKFGKVYRCWMENCSNCHRDWNKAIELCTRCFYDDYNYKLECPEDNMRLEYLRKVFQWEFSSSGMNSEGDGGLVCIKARLLEDDLVSTADDYRIILANTMTVAWLKNKQKLPDVTKKQLQSMLRAVEWEKHNIFNLLEQAASKLDRYLMYCPYVAIHQDFQGTGISKDMILKARRLLTAYCMGHSGKNLIGIGLCNNSRSLKIVESFGDKTVAHLHFKNPNDGSFYCFDRDKVTEADCYWITVAAPTLKQL